MKTKTRSANFTVPQQDRVTRWDSVSNPLYGQNVSGGSVSGRTWVSLSETISYNEPKRKGMGNCIHNRTSLQIYPSGHVFRTGTDPNVQKTTRSDFFIPATYPTWADYNGIPTVSNYSWKSLSAQAMDSILPTLSQGGESLVNFMLELKQLKDIVFFWKARQGPLKTFASSHLMYSFGWAPFLSDVKRLATALKQYQKKLRALQEGAGKRQISHYRRYADMVTLPPQTPAVDPSGTHRIEAKWVQQPIYCATVQYSYVMPDMSSVSNTIAGFLDSLGIQLNPSILWNAARYSFVIDWFFNVGEWLNRLRVDNLKIPATVTGFCHSLKYEYRYSYFHKPAPSFAPDGYEVQISMRNTLHYERRTDIPSVGLPDLTVKTPDWSKVLLGASLIVQRTRLPKGL